MGLIKKLAKKSDPELLALFFERGGWITSDGFVPRGEKEAQVALMHLGASTEGRKLLADIQEKLKAGKISKRGVPKPPIDRGIPE